MKKNNNKNLICLGLISGPHGINGAFKIKSFTENPEDIVSYGELLTSLGSSLKLKIIGRSKNCMIASSDGVFTRSQSENLKGQYLYVERDSLPILSEKDEYYQADLIGMNIVDEELSSCGSVVALYNFGAGDLIEIKFNDGSSGIYQFNSVNIKDIDIKNRKITIDKGLLEINSGIEEKDSLESAIG